jgi:hypothetical protein
MGKAALVIWGERTFFFELCEKKKNLISNKGNCKKKGERKRKVHKRITI